MTTIKFKVKVSEELEFDLELEDTKTILDLKQASTEKSQFPVEDMKIILKGRILKDEQTLQECKITEGAVVNLVNTKGPF